MQVLQQNNNLTYEKGIQRTIFILVFESKRVISEI